MARTYTTVSLEVEIGNRLSELAAEVGMTRPQFVHFLIDDYLRRKSADAIASGLVADMRKGE